MTIVNHQFDANCPPAALWTVLADLGRVAEYNDSVRSARISPAEGGRKGAIRICALVPKGEVTERVTEWEEGRSLGLEVVKSDWPVQFMNWVTNIEPAGSGSRVIQRLEYKMKFGPVGWLLNALVMRRAIERNVGKALKGMIALAEAAR